MSYNGLLIGLQSKRKTNEDQGEEFGKQETSIARCHATVLVHWMTAQMTTAITHVALKAETNCKKRPLHGFLLF